MKIQGVFDFRFRKTFRFETVTKADGSALEVVLTALPFGWDEDLDKQLGGMPSAPVRKVGEKNGEPIWRTIEEDADYISRRNAHLALRATAMLYHSMKGDASVAFDTSADMLKSDPRAFYVGIADEIKATGWPQIEVTRLIGAITSLSDASADGVEETKNSFFKASS